MITVLKGDLFKSQAQTLVNTVNCVGVMGKGIALEFKKRYPDMFFEYAEKCKRELVRPGEPYIYKDLAGASILNFPTKRHWKSPSELDDIRNGLDFLVSHWDEWGITSLAVPPLGCGNGGLSWRIVGPLIYGKLSVLPIPVEVYAPADVPESETGLEFLQSGVSDEMDAYEWNPARVAVLEILHRLEKIYLIKVGQVMFQKICYILSLLDASSQLKFGKGCFGPFSKDAQSLQRVLKNAKVLEEESEGSMRCLKVMPSYAAIRQKYNHYIVDNERNISKVVELFARVRSTRRAEFVATVLYSVQKMKQELPDKEIEERDLLDYVLGWKPRWNKAEDKETIAETIRFLLESRWMKIKVTSGFVRDYCE